MADLPLHNLIDAALADRDAAGLLRHRRAVRILDAMHVDIDGRRCVNFASNNYLGLTHHAAIIAAAVDATRRHGAGSAAAGLISGYLDVHAVAEDAFARWKGTEAAILLPSGYQANHAAIQTLAGLAAAAGRSIRFLVDKLVHASIVDAVRAGGQPMRVFPHNGIGKVARLLEAADPDQLQVVLTESIFSMDGDAADLPGLVALKRRLPFVLVVDEAHGSGVYGANGSGYAAECGVAKDVDVFIVTLSKALGSAGGVVCADTRFCEAAINFARAYIYTTSVAPSVAAAGEAALAVLTREPQRQQRVRAVARHVRQTLTSEGFQLPPGDSPIIPIVLGSEQSAMQAAEMLLENGILVAPVRPPTVARGGSRLRVTLSSEHTDGEIDYVLNLLCEGVSAGRFRPAKEGIPAEVPPGREPSP